MSSSSAFADFASAASAGFAVKGAFAISGGGAAPTTSFGVAVAVPVTIRLI